jgi:hypothetical protein
MATYSIALDVSHEPTFDEIAKWAASFNCTATLITEFGPAGGNPVYKFSTKNITNLENLCDDLGIDTLTFIENIEKTK